MKTLLRNLLPSKQKKDGVVYKRTKTGRDFRANFMVSKELWTTTKDHAKEHGVSASEVINLALSAYLDLDSSSTIVEGGYFTKKYENNEL